MTKFRRFIDGVSSSDEDDDVKIKHSFPVREVVNQRERRKFSDKVLGSSSSSDSSETHVDSDFEKEIFARNNSVICDGTSNNSDELSSALLRTTPRPAILCTTTSAEEDDDYRPNFSKPYSQADAPLELNPNCEGKESRVNKYIARFLLQHQVEGIKWLWTKYIAGEGAILGCG